MATIIVNIPGIAGESRMSGYAGQIDALGLNPLHMNPLRANETAEGTAYSDPGTGLRHTNREVERLWLNPSQVRWTYTPYTNGVAGGSVSKTFSIETSVAV